MAVATDTDSPTPYPHTKVSREDWLDLALDTLIEDGVERVKVMVLAERLDVSRSSFYWYFKSRQDLLDQLLVLWRDKNTAAIMGRAERPCQTIIQGVLSIFECWINSELFDPRLDFAIREWSRRDDRIRTVLDEADKRRVQAITEMFTRHGYAEREAFIRARVLYFMQVGYYALDLKESLETRFSYVEEYLRSFTGKEVTESDRAYFHRLWGRALSGR